MSKDKNILTHKKLNAAMKQSNKKAFRENRALGLDSVVARGGKVILQKADGSRRVIKTIPKPVKYSGQSTVNISADGE